MNKYKIIFSVMILISCVALLNLNVITGYFTYNPDLEIYSETKNQIVLGHCPTMEQESLMIAQQNDYRLIEFGSASEVLQALKLNQIDKALIGRKASQNELSENTRETILKSGSTLISLESGAVHQSELASIQVSTYISKNIAEILIPNSPGIIYRETKQEALADLFEGFPVLISWEDWEDEFELIIVMNEHGKAKEFRGVFLYEN